ncbi:MAG: hypothetical protein OXT09_18540 [Myxococcales bacterium]|nr:hypothetical protein [Myxococcales bacterium]
MDSWLVEDVAPQTLGARVQLQGDVLRHQGRTLVESIVDQYRTHERMPAVHIDPDALEHLVVGGCAMLAVLQEERAHALEQRCERLIIFNRNDHRQR